MNAKQLWNDCVDKGLKINNDTIELSPPLKVKLNSGDVKYISCIKKENDKFFIVENKPKFSGRLTSLC